MQDFLPDTYVISSHVARSLISGGTFMLKLVEAERMGFIAALAAFVIAGEAFAVEVPKHNVNSVVNLMDVLDLINSHRYEAPPVRSRTYIPEAEGAPVDISTSGNKVAQVAPPKLPPKLPPRLKPDIPKSELPKPELPKPDIAKPNEPPITSQFKDVYEGKTWTDVLGSEVGDQREIRGEHVRSTVEYLLSRGEKKIIDLVEKEKEVSPEQVSAEFKKGITERASAKGKPPWAEFDPVKGDFALNKSVEIGGVTIKPSKINLYLVGGGSLGLYQLIVKCKSEAPRVQRDELRGDEPKSSYLSQCVEEAFGRFVRGVLKDMGLTEDTKSQEKGSESQPPK